MYSTVEKQAFRDKTHETADDAASGARRIKEDVRVAANNVKSDLEDMAHQAGEQARTFVGNAEQNVTEIAESVTSHIKENPIQSSLIAVAVGMFLGLALFRRA